MIGGAIARLRAVVGLDDKEFKAGVRSVKGHAGGLQQTMAGVGGAIKAAFSVAAVTMFARSMTRWASGISLAAENAQVTTEQMVALNDVFIQNGLNAEQASMMLARLSQMQLDAARGTGQAREQFERLGLSIDDVLRLDPVELMQEVGRAAFDSGTPVATLADIFGQRLGPRAVSALRSIVNDGLLQVNAEIANQIDDVRRLEDEWTGSMDAMKRKTMELASNLRESFRTAKDFIRGYADAKERLLEQDVDGLALIRPAFSAALDAAVVGIVDRRAEATSRRDRQAIERRSALEELPSIFEETETAAAVAALESDLARVRSEMERATSIGGSVNISGRGIGATALQQVGGFIGSQRPEIAVADRSLQVQQRGVEELRRVSELTRQEVEISREIQQALSGRVI